MRGRASSRPARTSRPETATTHALRRLDPRGELRARLLEPLDLVRRTPACSHGRTRGSARSPARARESLWLEASSESRTARTCSVRDGDHARLRPDRRPHLLRLRAGDAHAVARVGDVARDPGVGLPEVAHVVELVDEVGEARGREGDVDRARLALLVDLDQAQREPVDGRGVLLLEEDEPLRLERVQLGQAREPPLVEVEVGLQRRPGAARRRRLSTRAGGSARSRRRSAPRASTRAPARRRCGRGASRCGCRPSACGCRCPRPKPGQRGRARDRARGRGRRGGTSREGSRAGRPSLPGGRAGLVLLARRGGRLGAGLGRRRRAGLGDERRLDGRRGLRRRLRDQRRLDRRRRLGRGLRAPARGRGSRRPAGSRSAARRAGPAGLVPRRSSSRASAPRAAPRLPGRARRPDRGPLRPPPRHHGTRPLRAPATPTPRSA